MYTKYWKYWLCIVYALARQNVRRHFQTTDSSSLIQDYIGGQSHALQRSGHHNLSQSTSRSVLRYTELRIIIVSRSIIY